MENSQKIQVRLNRGAIEQYPAFLDSVMRDVRGRISAVSHAYAEERITVTPDAEDPYLLHLSLTPESAMDPRDRETIIADLKRNILSDQVTAVE